MSMHFAQEFNGFYCLSKILQGIPLRISRDFIYMLQGVPLGSSMDLREFHRFCKGTPYSSQGQKRV